MHRAGHKDQEGELDDLKKKQRSTLIKKLPYIMTELKDWLNSINTNKTNLIDEDPDVEKSYPSYIINRCLSGQIDSVMFANEMNKHPNLAKKLQYDFFLNSLRKRKRFSPWLRKDQIKNLELVKSYYGYSNEKAKQVLNILTREQLSFIRDRLETGGKK